MAFPLGHVKTVIFDMDGVLVDSWHSWFELVNLALETHQKPRLDKQSFEAIWGQGIQRDREMFFPELTIRELQSFYESRFKDVAHRVILFPETHPVLSRLRRLHVKTVLASNSPRRIVEAVIQAHDLSPFFDFFLGSDDVNHPKPAPDLLMRALDLTETKSDESVFVGDSAFDREAAQAAGVPFIGYRCRGEVSINSLTDLFVLEGTGTDGSIFLKSP